MELTKKIYTAGKMSGTALNKQMKWRLEIEKAIKDRINTPIIFVHPPLFYNYEHNFHYSEAEVKEFDTNQVRNSDIVVVNLEDIDSSVGTHFELGLIDAVNSFGNKHIWVVGIGNPENIHPWINLSMMRVEPDIETAADYICNYLI